MLISDIANIDRMEEVTGFIRMQLPKKDSKMKLPENISALFWNVRSLTYVAVLETGEVKSYVKEDTCWLALTNVGNQMFNILLGNKTLRPVKLPTSN